MIEFYRRVFIPENRDKIAAAALGATTLALLALGIIDLWTGPERNDYVSLIHTDNPVNWLTALNLIMAGLAATRVCFLVLPGGADLDWKGRWIWPALASVFMFGGLDELLDFHERLDGLISARAAQTEYNAVVIGVFHGTFLLLGYAIGAVAVFFLLRPALRRDVYAMLAFRLALFCQLVALTCERFFQWADSAPKPWVFIAYLEETAELYGTLLFALAMIFIMMALEHEEMTRSGGQKVSPA